MKLVEVAVLVIYSRINILFIDVIQSSLSDDSDSEGYDYEYEYEYEYEYNDSVLIPQTSRNSFHDTQPSHHSFHSLHHHHHHHHHSFHSPQSQPNQTSTPLLSPSHSLPYSPQSPTNQSFPSSQAIPPMIECPVCKQPFTTTAWSTTHINLSYIWSLIHYRRMVLSLPIELKSLNHIKIYYCNKDTILPLLSHYTYNPSGLIEEVKSGEQWSEFSSQQDHTL